MCNPVTMTTEEAELLSARDLDRIHDHYIDAQAYSSNKQAMQES